MGNALLECKSAFSGIEWSRTARTKLYTMPKEKTAAVAEVLGPFEVDEVKRPKSSSKRKEEVTFDLSQPSDGEDKKKKHKKRAKEEPQDEEPTKDKKKSKKNRTESVGEDEGEEENNALTENEMSLGERLEMLSKQISTLENPSASSSKILGEVPTTESMVTLLDQALQSGDEELLEQCLQCSNVDIISATTRQLSTHRVLVLLKKLVAKFERRPSRGLLITQWLAYILKHHLAYLITVPDLAKQLAGLSQMLEQRMQSYTRLSSLAGRLDLLMAQVSATALQKDGQDQALVPQTIFRED